MSARIVVEDLTKRHEGRVVLDRINLEIRDGEVLGIVGQGGHGKSVLLKMLPRLLTPDAGRVLVDGKDLAKMTSFELARAREGFGYLFQNYALFDFMTVADNIAFPLRQEHRHTETEIDARVRARLKDVGLERAYHQFPRELSGGMKKRIGLARATVTNPTLAIYDDPTAGLDPVTSSRIFALIRDMHEKVPGCATVIVSHDIDRMVPIITRWVILEHGRIVFDGAPATLATTLARTSTPLLSAFFGSTPLSTAGPA
jgi:phospholipid/cholesterol/gamma-HCH transport system ATP-binding protein